jgi:hypothetical protein
MLDSAHEHVVACSPCFRELTAIQRALQRRKILMWAMGTTGTIIVVLAVWLTFFASHGPDSPQTAQTQKPSESSTPPSPQPEYELALLDLRNASAARTATASGANSNVPAIETRRGLLALTVQLPVGSEAGTYEVEIRNSNQQPVHAAKATATIENGITKLLINMDTRSIPPGEYHFAWRMADFSWRHQQISIR